MTTGKWMPKRKKNAPAVNEVLIKALRTAWRTLQARRPKEVSMEHVRSHILIPGNELVDWLAAKMDDRIQIKHAEEWINTWLAEQDTEDGYFHPSIT
jgi:ribonuclease HI